MSYDLIGNIHGCYHTLTALLEKLGYKLKEGIYHHPTRRVIFLGDFIDRGAHQRDVIELVKGMMECEQALSVMGNHEFNAIAYATQCHEGEGYLRPHSDKNKKQHETFLNKCSKFLSS